ncbi:hypothetical protein RRG08_034149 [Elysia crispata]|uniref:Uncharacterized protein n=1 Tax=Elysia crispata TaxID=231223 RepID=A0AAE1DIY9_9GAST|nr:hypothetical protein RRG08_034149 [Elysia crispata]
MRHGLDSASSESWPADSPCRCPPPPLSPASSSSSAYRRHSVTLSSGPSHYGNRSPPPVTLVAAAPDSTTPAITMTMAPQDGPFSLPNSMGALFLSGCASGASMTSPLMMDWVYEQSIIQSKPNCGPTSRTMRRYSHEIPREFSIPSMLQNFSLTSMGPTVGPSMSLSVGSPSSSIQQRFPVMPGGATSTILRSYSLPRNVDSLTTAAGPSPCFSISHMPGFALAQGDSGSNSGPPTFPLSGAGGGGMCFSISDLHLEAGMPGFALAQGDSGNNSGPPTFPLSGAGGGDMPGFPLTGIRGTDSTFMPQLALGGGHEWLLPLEAFLFSGFHCIESLA